MLKLQDINNPRLLILEVAEIISSQLLPIAGHAVRNPYAHIYGMIKALCGVSYTKADPIKVCSVVEAIKSNPNGSQVEILALAKQIRREHLDATGKVDTANSNPPH